MRASCIIAVLALRIGISRDTITLEPELDREENKALHAVEYILSRFKTDKVEEESDE